MRDGVWNWPHVDPRTVACRCCGETFVDPAALAALERLALSLGETPVVTSGHRCAQHNARVGGAPLSMHKRLAFDIALAGHDKARLVAAARAAGFTGFGFGQTFLHCDTRARPAHWFYGQRSMVQWTSVLCWIPA
jgi:Peptidase M15.